ncbi:MAG: hypothetical protein JWQ98_2668 [Chlorobi bacterium]|nr:hypothetical protein [Chlorobiota bacterium]
MRSIQIAFIVLLALVAGVVRSSAQSQDTSVIIITLDGKSYPATAVAYAINGKLFINGIWVADSTRKLGPSAIASAYSLRVDDRVGQFAVSQDDKLGPLFSAVYSAPAGRKVYTIYRADERGGTGTVTITAITDRSIKGTFSFTAMNTDLVSDQKTIAGNFDVAFRRLDTGNP